MVQYLIIKCEKCGNFIAIKENSKSFRCPYCGIRSTVVDSFGKMRFKIYAVADGREVPKKLAELKRLEKI
ncbi:MAG: hypothetical protein QXF17_02840 [Ignisphaera sp.]